MLANSVLWNVRHPMEHLPRDSRVYLAEDGSTEIVGPGYEDLRFFVIAMVDPFDLIGLAMGRHIRKEFWKEEQGKAKGGDEESGVKEDDAEKDTSVNGDGSVIAKEKGSENIEVVEEKGGSSGHVSKKSRDHDLIGS